MELDNTKNFEFVPFFFVDIVGLSNPVLSITTQTSKLHVFNECISQCKTIQSTPRDEMIVLPTGDGMAIGFINAVEKPIKFAIELHEKLNDYNKDKASFGKIITRIGCHIGSVFVVKDAFGNLSCWGPGTILARRVMDIGDANHILMTQEMAETLSKLSDEYKKIIHPVHDYQIKHGQKMLIYSIHGNNFGNPKRPLRGLHVEDKLVKSTNTMKNKISVNKAEINLFLKEPKTNLLRCKRSSYFANVSDEPIFEVIEGIITGVEKSFFELNVQAYDENDKEISVAGINVDTPYRKEFSLKLNSPINKGETEKKYSLAYEVEEPTRCYENSFLLNSDNFVLTFNFPTDQKLNPKLYLIKNSDKEKLELKSESTKVTGLRTKMIWTKPDGIIENNLIRFQW